MSMVRLNITLPYDLSSKLNSLVRPRQRSQFITTAVQQKIKELEENALQKQLEEGYKARREEGRKITKEFGNLDLEGWDEY